MFYFCFLFIATYVHVHTIDVAPKSLTLGFIGPTNLPNTNTQTGGHPALFAVKLAIQEINARSDLLPRTKLKLIINNTNSDVGTGAVVAFWQCIFANVIGIIGEYTSVVSQVKRIRRAYELRFSFEYLLSRFNMPVDITKFLKFPMDQRHLSSPSIIKVNIPTSYVQLRIKIHWLCLCLYSLLVNNGKILLYSTQQIVKCFIVLKNFSQQLEK